MSSYDDKEASIDDGQPYFLYLFDDGITQTRLASGAADILADPEELGTPQLWTRSPVAHKDILVTGNVEKQNNDLTFPLSDPFARSLLQPSSALMSVTIWRGHHTDLSGKHSVEWIGSTPGATSGEHKIIVPVGSIFADVRRIGCNVPYQRSCRHALYFDGCNLNIDDFKVAATATAVAGVTLTVPAAALEADGWYSHGAVIFGGLMGWVTKHVGNKLTLSMPMPGLAEAITANGSASIFIARGCDLLIKTCRVKFNNHLNHGGFPSMKREDPFTQSIV